MEFFITTAVRISDPAKKHRIEGAPMAVSFENTVKKPVSSIKARDFFD
jgi:hypothetical protein